MAERVFPASKPAPPPPASNGTTAPHVPPKPRPQYRPQPNRAAYRQRSRKSICCRCIFWTVLVLLVLILLAAVAGVLLYVVYRPHRPLFKVASLRVQRFNLTASADGSSHLAAFFNVTITSRNPNSHISFSYDKFAVTAVASDTGVVIGNGSIPTFLSSKKNEATFRNVIVSSSTDLDGESAGKLKAHTKRTAGGERVLPMKLLMDTKVVVKAGKIRSKRVGIRVTCDGIQAVAPGGKSGSTAAVSTGVSCKVDHRIKIWKFTF